MKKKMNEVETRMIMLGQGIDVITDMRTIYTSEIKGTSWDYTSLKGMLKRIFGIW